MSVGFSFQLRPTPSLAARRDTGRSQSNVVYNPRMTERASRALLYAAGLGIGLAKPGSGCKSGLR